jgi:hypothetical protein
MPGSPRNLMLIWANTVTGWWTSVAVAAVQRQQRGDVERSMGKGRSRRSELSGGNFHLTQGPLPGFVVSKKNGNDFAPRR